MDASDEQLYRELKWLVPTTSLSTYVTAGRWHRKLLQVDLELIKAHRREAGAPEAAPVDLSQVLPELHGRVLLPHDAPEQETMTQEVRVLKPPPPPAAPAYPNNGQAPPRQTFTSTKTASVKHAPPQSAPSKGVIKDGIVKTSSSSSTRLTPGGFAWGGRAPSRHSEMSHKRHFTRQSYPYSAVTEEVKSLPSRDGSKNAEEAAPRQSFTSTKTASQSFTSTKTASVKHAPPQSAPSKGVIKDGIVKTSSSSSTRSVPSAPLGARSPKGPMAKQGGPNTTKRPGDWHDTRSDSGPKRSAPPATTPAKPKSPAPPKGPPPGRTATPPKHPPQQKGLPPPKPKGPTGPTPPRHAPAPKKGSAPPRTAPASQSSRTAPASQSSASTPQKGAGPPKGSSKGSSLPKSGPSKAPTKTVAKEGSMNRPRPKGPSPPQGAPPGRAMVKQGVTKTPSRPVSHDRTAIGASQGSGTPPRPSSAPDRPPPKARPGSSGPPGDLIRKMLG